MGVEASGEYAQTGILDTSKDAEMLPPKGNDDWDRVTVPIVKVDISTTHPSVASASYIL